ncbi:MAG TPA: T9SS type A sorting domain-containing protein [Ignavibacteria bacterium]|nr:T9SS type A sorting domain-containing protein [Ignavibacteria bacterium]HMQ99938.1 T9SS type A sorting domain-containing protein [Ignavibacteria bacterium]
MRKISIIVFFLLVSINVFSQFPESYPFETYLDQNENLYVTGTYQNDILIIKYNSNGGQLLWEYYPNTGQDKGMDIVSSANGEFIYVAGYSFNSATGEYNIQILKYQDDGFNDILVWHREYGSALDNDKAYGITIDANENVYVCGYVTNFDMTTDYITLKYDSDGVLVWERKYEIPGNEVATDILTDNYYLYVIGYKDETPDDLGSGLPTKDIMLLTYLIDDPIPTPTIIDLPGSTEIPTSFKITELSMGSVPPIVSKLATSGYQEKIVGRLWDKNYFVAFYDRNVSGSENIVGWSRDWGTYPNDDIATEITADNSGNLVVTGYFDNSGNDDFGTLKFDKTDNSIIWGPIVHDIDDGQDRASSVFRYNNTYAVSGYSQYSQTNSYITKKFTEINSQFEESWSSAFVPEFSENENWEVYTDFSTDSYILSDNSIVTVAFAWNNDLAEYSIVKYDSSGQELYTVEPGAFRSGNRNNERQGMEIPKQFELKHNYPNPFNPVTMISYSIPEQSFVTLKVYDMMGKEVARLVSTTQNAGNYTKQFDAGKLASGIYIYRLTATNSSNRYEKTEKMTLIK